MIPRTRLNHLSVDPANYSKSIEQMLRLLHALGRDVSFTVTRRTPAKR